MIDTSKKLKCNLAFELQNTHVFQKCSKILCIILQPKRWQTLWCHTLSLSVQILYQRGTWRQVWGFCAKLTWSSWQYSLEQSRRLLGWYFHDTNWNHPPDRTVSQSKELFGKGNNQYYLSQSTVIQCHLHSPNSFTRVSLYLKSEESVKFTSVWCYSYFFDPTPLTA